MRKKSSIKDIRNVISGKRAVQGKVSEKPLEINGKHTAKYAVPKKIADLQTGKRGYVSASNYPVPIEKGQLLEDAEVRNVIIVSGNRPEHRLTAFEKIELVEDGITKKALEKLKEKADMDYDQLASVLNVARATLINKKGQQKFSKDVSDKILGLADIYSYGNEVFDDRYRFNEWVFRENQALGGQAPFNLLHYSFGREEVKNLIGRIDYGIYS